MPSPKIIGSSGQIATSFPYSERRMSFKRERNGVSRKGCLLLCSVLVHVAKLGNAHSAIAVAFLSPLASTRPFRASKNAASFISFEQCGIELNRKDYVVVRHFRSLQTKLSFSSSVNGLAAHEHKRSTSIFNVGYDAMSIINFYDQRPWEVGLRLNLLGLPLLGEFDLFLT